MDLKSLNNGQLFVLAAILKNEIESLDISREKQWITPAAEIIDDFISKGILQNKDGKITVCPFEQITLAQIAEVNPWSNPLGYINNFWYSDIRPYEIVRQVTKTKMFIRPMKVNGISLNKMDFVIGGFSAHCTNQGAAVYLIESDPSRSEFPVRWSEVKGAWFYKGMRFVCQDKPRYFYDFNF